MAKLLRRLKSRLQGVVPANPNLALHLHSIGSVIDRPHSDHFFAAKIQVPKIHLAYLIPIFIRYAIVILIRLINNFDRIQGHAVGLN